jgi:hypothetical protein
MRIFSLTLDNLVTEKQFWASQQAPCLREDLENALAVNTLQIVWKSGIILAL